jgi:hypothetical protein
MRKAALTTSSGVIAGKRGSATDAPSPNCNCGALCAGVTKDSPVSSPGIGPLAETAGISDESELVT